MAASKASCLCEYSFRRSPPPPPPPIVGRMTDVPCLRGVAAPPLRSCALWPAATGREHGKCASRRPPPSPSCSDRPQPPTQRHPHSAHGDRGSRGVGSSVAHAVTVVSVRGASMWGSKPVDMSARCTALSRSLYQMCVSVRVRICHMCVCGRDEYEWVCERARAVRRGCARPSACVAMSYVLDRVS